MTIKELLYKVLIGNASIDDLFDLVFSVFLITTLLVILICVLGGVIYLSLQMILDLLE